MTDFADRFNGLPEDVTDRLVEGEPKSVELRGDGTGVVTVSRDGLVLGTVTATAPYVITGPLGEDAGSVDDAADAIEVLRHGV